MPDLAESDVESVDDDNNSLPDFSEKELGGEVDDPADRDQWADHPDPIKLDFDGEFDEDVPPEPPDRKPPDPSSASEEADDGLGRSVDGKSRRLRHQYFCSLGTKQMPPGVRRGLNQQRVSRKRSEYRKRLKRKREQADALMMQAEFDVPTVEALMACPLSRFIHFAANDCGYKGTRYDLIANWVHPLFLKAKSEASNRRIIRVGARRCRDLSRKSFGKLL